MKKLLIFALISGVLGCTKSTTIDETTPTKCYECTTYTDHNIHTTSQVSESETLLNCGLTAADVIRMNGDTSYVYAYYYGSVIGEVVDTVFIHCQ